MRLKLLKDHGNLRAGTEFTCPWVSVGAKLIAEGVALAVEAADLHLNPRPAEVPTSEPAAELPAPPSAAVASVPTEPLADEPSEPAKKPRHTKPKR